MIALHPLTAFPESAWKNGHGRTRELAQGGTAGETWRISLASIEGNGPFSLFPGLIRHLALASPGHLVLTAAGQCPHHLNHAGAVLSFSGTDATMATCPSGPVMAFNLMASYGCPAYLFTHKTPFILPPAEHFTLLPLSGVWRVAGHGPVFGPDSVLQGKKAAETLSLEISPVPQAEVQTSLCLAAIIPLPCP